MLNRILRRATYIVRHEPDDPDRIYRYQVDIYMPWCKDEDGLPRHEIGHGYTEEEARDQAKAIVRGFRRAIYTAPGAWPKGSP